MKNRLFKNSLLLVILVLTMVLAVACGSSSNTPSNDSGAVKSMTGEELVKQNSGKDKDKVLIIDVRSPEEYKAGHIQHAINMNIDGFEDRISEIEDLKDFPIILYCNSGKKSGQVADILVEHGFKNVTNATGVKEYEYDLVHYEDIRGSVFQKLIDENSDIVLVDVRESKQAGDEGMIAGAINVPFNAVEENLDKLPKDKTIALYCNTGTKSAEVAKQLEDLGYENVVNAIEGVKEYEFTLVK